MSFLSRLSAFGRNWFKRSRTERDLDDELHSYLDQLTEENRGAGLSADEARRTALMELGGLEQVKEEVRQVRTGQMLEQFVQDLRYGVRTLRRSLAFTFVAVLALALGIGANTAMFSVAYGILFRPLPYAGADRVAVIYMSYFPRDFRFGTMCIRDYLTWKENNRAFEDPSLFRSQRMNVAGNEGVPEQVQGASVTAGFFSTFGVPALAGRTFAAGEDQPGNASLTVLSESLWRRRFAASRNILGGTILMNGAPSTVIGVMPDVFRFPGRATEVWTNFPLDPPTRYGPWFYRGVARLKPGVTLRKAQTELNQIGQRMMQENPYYKQLTLPVLGLRDALLGAAQKSAILTLAGAVGLVLLIAVVNVANLMLARATVREREMALRLSLGAGGKRLVRQLLTESILLALLGGTAGLALAWGITEFIRVWNPGNLALIDSVRIDRLAFLFTILVSLLTGILFGLAPAIESTRTDVNSTIKKGGRGGEGRSRGRLREALVVWEIAASLTLLVGAGLLLRSFLNLERVTGGLSIPPRNILTILVSPDRRYDVPRPGLAFYDEILRRARTLPGVETASVTDSLPPDRQGDADTFEVEGHPSRPGEINPVVSHVTAGPDLFRTLGIPLLKGRPFSEHDGADSSPVMIVSEGFARRFLPNREPLGTRVSYNGVFREIVGIVGDVKYLGLAVDTDAAYYIPFAQSYLPRMYLVVRSSGDAASLADALRQRIQSADPGLTLAQIGTMEEALNSSIAQPRFVAMLLALFAGIALLLGAVGIYGLIAYSIAQRAHEIGVRLALGAGRAQVVGMVLRQVASLAALGISGGLVGAFALTRFLDSMLFGISVTDALTFVAAPSALVIVVLFATFIPTLRATRISPVAALRIS